MCFLLIISHSKMIYDNFKLHNIFRTLYEKDHIIHVCGLRRKNTIQCIYTAGTILNLNLSKSVTSIAKE